MNTYERTSPASCGLAARNSRAQVAINHLNQLVNIDPRQKGFGSSRTQETFPSGCVAWIHTLMLVPLLVVCSISAAAQPALPPLQLSSWSTHPSRACILQPCNVPKHLPLPPGQSQYSQFPSCLPPTCFGLSSWQAGQAVLLARRQERAGASPAPLSGKVQKQNPSALLNHPFPQNLQADSVFAISVLLPNLVEIECSNCWCRGND